MKVSSYLKPKTLQNDRGKEFMAYFVGMCSKLGIKIAKSRPGHPQFQGKVRTNVIETKVDLITYRVDPLFSCLKKTSTDFFLAPPDGNHIQCNAVITRSISHKYLQKERPSRQFGIQEPNKNKQLLHHLIFNVHTWNGYQLSKQV